MGTGIIICGLNGAGKSTMGKVLAFFRFASSRAENTVEEWVRSVSCPVIRVDGTEPMEENVKFVIERIRSGGLASVVREEEQADYEIKNLSELLELF